MYPTGIQVNRSFSWIGAMNRKATGDGALFEWDNDQIHSTHIWIHQNKFYVNVMFSSGCNHMQFFSSAVQNNEWHILALSYNADTRKVSMFMKGENEEALTTCTGDLKPATYVRISKR